MAYSMLGQRGLLMVMLGCVGCDAAASEDADPTQQGLGQQSPDDAGFLVPTLIGDAGRDTSLTTRIAPKADAGVGDAGQVVAQGDAGQEIEEQGDTGQTVRVLNVEATDNLPDCAAVYYRDIDGDGFGDANAKVTSCTQPSGYVENGDDCYDDNERAHPNATGQFLQQRGDGSFDYDCDGVETKLQLQVAACPTLDCTGLGCDVSVLELVAEQAENGGWTEAKVPACGQDASWGLSASWFPGVAKAVCAAPDGVTRKQTCR